MRQDSNEIIKINEFLFKAAPFIISWTKAWFESLGLEVEENRGGADVNFFVIKSGKVRIKFFPYNMMLDIAGVERVTPLVFDKRVQDLDFFLHKTDCIVQRRISFIFQTLNEDNTDGIIMGDCRARDYSSPFVFDADDVPATMTEFEISRCRQKAIQPPDSSPQSETDQASVCPEESSIELLDSYEFTKADMDFLELLAKNPYQHVLKLIEIGLLSMTEWYRLRMRFDSMSPRLLQQHRVATGRRGKRVSVALLTDIGWQIVDKLNIKYPEPRGTGSVEHKFWQYAVSYYMAERNHRARIDYWKNNKVVDVGVEKWEGKSTAFEIVTADIEIEVEKEKEMSRLICALNTGWDRIILCTLAQKEQDLLKNEMSKWFKNTLFESGRVSFMKLHTFLERKEYKQS